MLCTASIGCSKYKRHKNMIWNIMINYRNATCWFSLILILFWVLFSIAENRLSSITTEMKYTSRIKRRAINRNIDKACWQLNDTACERFLFIWLPPTMHCISQHIHKTKPCIRCIPHMYVIMVIDIDGMATPQR